MTQLAKSTLQIAGVLYTAYYNRAGGKSLVSGSAIPTWDELVENEARQDVVEAWAEVARTASALPLHKVTDQPDIDGTAEATGAMAEIDRQSHVLENKALRQRLDSAVEHLRTSEHRSAERTLALRAIQTARHWLGEGLALLKEPYPYPKGNDATKVDVDAPADKAPTT